MIRFDNRDIGLSTKFADAGLPDIGQAMAAAFTGQKPSVPYTLDDMADDAAGLLDALRLDSVHVCGASMGGMIAQTLAIGHPARVRSLTSIMSTTGDMSLPQATAEAMSVLMTPPPAERNAVIERAIHVLRVIGSPGFPVEEERVRKVAGRSFDRSFHPDGVARQLAAILAHGDRTARLRALRLPTLVIHGEADPLVRFEGGRATADAIPGARLMSIEGMGHDLPRPVWSRIVEAISDLTRSTDADVAKAG